MEPMFQSLNMTAQTTFAELCDQVLDADLRFSLSGLTGSFNMRAVKGKNYWYFGYRDIDGDGKMVYVGPDEPRVRSLVDRFKAEKKSSYTISLAQAALALGCEGVLPKHFKIIKRLAEYGLFRAGGILIGTHAFTAFGNMLGVRWLNGQKTMDVDFAHAGRNISVALPTNIAIDVHGALQSLEMGLLPISQFSGKTGAQYRNPDDPELRLDFVTCEHRDEQSLIRMPHMNFALEPLKFMEFSLTDTTQTCVISREGACVVNIPAPERYAIHKLIVFGERPISERTKANKDLVQAASLISFCYRNGRSEELKTAWQDAQSRGKGWRKRIEQGWQALVVNYPDLAAVRAFLDSPDEVDEDDDDYSPDVFRIPKG